ncbi:uncharacterized protein I303_102623 [Kwoniella dejecticola CBS 10117]|uniref:Monooxygenase n=1 Tax=Kwoniella dejecticola CBS 10117 TaxID=1296121 RepID=A0A1A6A994_9TREE|nr:uncharacterized protein I303_02637 [Kwoniella dejecticola CBS 10117]OBR86628.1 hypothetical protein I303_02637 [Kwoniella dejecticola CBS 10117]
MTLPLSDESSHESTTRIGIIGAGASGLAQLQQLLEIWEERKEVTGRSKLEVVVYETKDDVGGVWLTDDQPKPNIRTHLPSTSSHTKGDETDDSVKDTYSYPPAGENPSPMYQGLRTNLPHDLMAFRGFPFPDNSPLFPKQEQVEQYLQSFADHYSLRQYIRFSTRVERVYHTQKKGLDSDTSKRWTIGSHDLLNTEEKTEEFDYVVVSNGHYSDGWIPTFKGLSTFPGGVIHSRFFHRASDYHGKTVLVVGSFASGGDISRILGSENLATSLDDDARQDGDGSSKFIKVYVSTSGYTQYSALEGPWAKHITHLPLISHISPPSSDRPKGIIHFEEDEGTGEKAELESVDVIIFATGYNFMFPFFRPEDAPWNTTQLSEGIIRLGERDKGDEWEEGGIKGQGVEGLDELLLFLKGDRTISFPTLSYQNVPFPLAQVQARFTAYLWAGLLTGLPDHPKSPPNPSNPYSSTAESESKPNAGAVNGDEAIKRDEEDKGQVDPPQPAKKPRKVLQRIKQLVFGAPYEWTYSEFLMDFMTRSDEAHGVKTKEYWKKVEQFRRDRREDTGLRKRTLGY